MEDLDQHRGQQHTSNGEDKQRETSLAQSASGSSEPRHSKTREKGRVKTNRESKMEEVYCMGHCGVLHQKMWFKVILFLFLSALNIADLLSDWLFYSDVAFTEEGLVYGPPEEQLIIALLVLSIVGSLTFIFETTNMALEIFKRKGWVNIDVASAITIWIEDVPQIIINVIIASCREEAISYFQLCKAAVVIIGVVIRIIITLIRYCSKKYLAEVHQHTAESCRHVTTRAFIVIGLFVMCTGSVTVFVFTQTYRSPDGKITFQVPQNLLKGTYNDQRYFENVSMYFNHMSFSPTTSNYPSSLKWVSMASIYDVRNRTTNDSIFSYSFRDQASPRTVIIADNSQKTENIETKECYTQARNSLTFTSVPCPSTPDRSQYTQIIFRFHHIVARVRLIFGDIHYNVRIRYSNGTFENKADLVDTRQESEESADKNIFGYVHYYRNNLVVNGDHHIMKTGNTWTYYQDDLHLTDIDLVWKTGFTYCEPTGSLAPHLDQSLHINDDLFF